MLATSQTARRPHRRTSRHHLAVALLAALFAVALAPAATPDADATEPAAQAPALTVADLGLEAVAGFGGQSMRYTWMPVTVRMAPRQLFSGTLEVATSTGVTEQREVEVAGNAVKQFSFVVPSGSVRIRAIPAGSDQAVQIRPDVDGRPNGAMVGLPSTDGTIPAGLPAVELAATAERVVWVPVDPAFLEATHLVLGGLSTLVLSPDDVATLSDAGRANLERAVLAGLNLVVVAPTGTVDLALENLPVPGARIESVPGSTVPAVVPGTDAFTLLAGDAVEDAGEAGLVGTEVVAASAPAGHGRVTLTGIEPISTAAPTAWAHLAAQRDAGPRLDGEHNNNGGWVAQQAISSGGALDVPSLRLLAIFALAYLLVAGPGNALLLQRLGRRELGWVTVPAITVTFVAIAFVVASGTQPRVGLTGATVTWTDGLGEELAITAVRAPAGGEHAVVLPGPDWVVQGTADFGGTGSTVDRASGDVRATMELGALQIGTILARRPTAEPAPLSIDVRELDELEFEVEVRNDSGRTLEDLELRVGGHHAKVGNLAPGESTSTTVDLAQLAALDVYVDIFQDSRRFDGSLEAPTSLRAMISGTALGDRPGSIVVVADDPDAPSPILADDEPTQSIGRVVAVEVPLDGRRHVSPAEVQRALLVGAFNEAWQPSPHAVEGELTAFLRYRLPARAAGRIATVTADVSRGQGWIEGIFGGGPVPEPIPVPADERCLVIEDRFPDGAVGSSTECGIVGDVELPPCPEDAISCEFGEDFWFFEFDDGRSQTGRVQFGAGDFVDPRGRQGGNASDFLEVFDHGAGRWGALPAGGALGLQHVSPFGEVFLRVSGGLYPFDYSARGITATLNGVSA